MSTYKGPNLRGIKAKNEAINREVARVIEQSKLIDDPNAKFYFLDQSASTITFKIGGDYNLIMDRMLREA